MIDVVIAGAGPNGLMLAGELGLAGLRPVVLDPLPGPNPGRRANGIFGQGVRILDHRGLYDVLNGADGPPELNPRAMFAAFSLDVATVPESQTFLLPVQQPRLVRVLAEWAAAHGVDIRWGHSLAGFDQDAEGVTVRIDRPDGPYELRAGYLVGADGGTSRTRKLAGIDFPGMSSHDMTARMGFDVLPPAEWVDPASGGVEVPEYGHIPSLGFHRTEHGVIARGALGGRPVVIVFELDSAPRESPNPDVDETAPMTLEELEASATRVLGKDLRLRPTVPAASLDLRRFQGINSRLASSYRAGRVLLVGDAAHVHSPMGGPGLNLGLQDAVNLGWKLAAVVQGRRVAADLLDTYEAERRPAAERVIMHSRAQLALVRPGPEVTALRELFAELLAAPEAVRRLADLISGADTRYLTDGAARDAHPLTGYWVPEFAVADGGGGRRIAELARSGRPLLIDLTDGAVVAGAVTDGVGADGALTVAVGRPADAVAASALLVRPDGYVAWASSAAAPDDAELTALRDALARWFGIRARSCARGRRPGDS